MTRQSNVPFGGVNLSAERKNNPFALMSVVATRETFTCKSTSADRRRYLPGLTPANFTAGRTCYGNLGQTLASIINDSSSVPIYLRMWDTWKPISAFLCQQSIFVTIACICSLANSICHHPGRIRSSFHAPRASDHDHRPFAGNKINRRPIDCGMGRKWILAWHSHNNLLFGYYSISVAENII